MIFTGKPIEYEEVIFYILFDLNEEFNSIVTVLMTK